MSTVPSPQPPDWAHCGHGADPGTDPVGCRGIHVPGHTVCLAHIEPQNRAAYLASLVPRASIDHRGTPFTEPLLHALLQALRDQYTGTPHFGSARFDGATFAGPAEFAGATFAGPAEFAGATFSGPAFFVGATFHGDAQFGGATFHDVVVVTGTFRRDAFFDWATFTRDAVFEVWVGGHTSFRSAVFAEALSFDDATFTSLTLDGARVSREVRVQCWAEQFRMTKFRCPDGLNLQLAGPLHIDATKVHSPELTLNSSDGFLELANATFGTPTTIAAGPEPAPRLLSLDRVDTTNLTLAGLDLEACRFLGAYNRDQLRIDGRPQFAGQPEGRWTRRQVLAEEHLWRARYDRRPTGWFPEACRHPDEQVPPPSATRTDPKARNEAARIQTIYRDLRKGREDAKDEPGAADFYYGEMEMRRLAASPRSVERVLLTAYWAVAGYGQRASRAVLWLGLAMAATVLTLMAWGLPTRTPLPKATGTLTGSAISLSADKPDLAITGDRWTLERAGLAVRVAVNSVVFRASGQNLTPAGTGIELASRILEPILLALAVLAVRERVKR
ncbi:pentapeptide repeat-containing protein [Kitasatospora sp. NPDC101447]|uniref:pentapeptide repeat-containing protein n=1 Tax=Kitasatospora sp. NPDC101447 TaxID=3364102 RepID=UPI0037F157CD